MSNMAIQKYLKKLSKINDFTKGDIGEKIVFEVLKKYKSYKREALLIHTVQYPYVKGIPGNIKQDNQMIYEVEGDTFNDDTDILFITSYRIFVIEVKAYRGKVKLTNEWTYHLSKADEKSVLCQAEKHARHFYHTFYSYIPDGNPEYIIPLVVFTDKCDLDDTRDSKWKKYIPACILNNLNASVANLDKPLDYKIDISNFHKGIKDYATKIGETFL